MNPGKTALYLDRSVVLSQRVATEIKEAPARAEASLPTPRCSCLLDRLAVQREIEAVAFDFLADAKSDDEIDKLEDDQRHHDVVDEHDADADELIDDLAAIAFDQSGRAAVLVDGEDAGQDGAGGAADAVHAE